MVDDICFALAGLAFNLCIMYIKDAGCVHIKVVDLDPSSILPLRLKKKIREQDVESEQGSSGGPDPWMEGLSRILPRIQQEHVSLGPVCHHPGLETMDSYVTRQ